MSALATQVLAADNVFGATSPLIRFIDFIAGPFAYGVVIVALVATVGTLALGGEFSGFARRMPIVVVAGAIVILADTVLGNLFGGARGFSVPPDMPLEVWRMGEPDMPDGVSGGTDP